MRPIDEAVRERVRTRWDENLVVVASAGTGKTTLLVDRVVAGVAAGVYRPENVVLVTYLSKSCDEIAARLTERLKEAADAVGGVERSRLVAALTDIDRFRITTLHALGYRLLKRYAAEVGIAPEVEVWDAVEAVRQRRLCLTVWLAGEPPEHTRLITELSRLGIGFSALERWLRDLGALDADRIPSPVAPEPAAKLLARAKHRLDALKAVAAAAVAAEDPARVQIMEFSRAVDRHIKLGEAWCDAALFRWQPARRQFGAKKDWAGNEAALAEQKAALKDLIGELDRWRQSYLTHLLARVALMARDFEEVFWEWRRQRRAIHYGDQVDRALKLLATNPAVRRDAAGTFTTIMVDEFQDTTPRQVELVQWLAADPHEDHPDPDRPPPGRLMIVGDPKQSIYRFQQANLKNAMAWVERLRASGAAEVVALTANFRSHPDVLQPVNALFGELWAPSAAGGDDPVYDPLYAHREDPAEPRLFYQTGLAGTADQRRDVSAKVTADVLRAAIGRPWRDRTGATKPLRYSDMAVLLPARTGLRQWTDALSAAGIPFHVSGREFYAREDVRGLAACLRAAVRPEDRVGVLAALRSAWIRVEDRELARHRAGGGAWHPWAEAPLPSAAVSEAFALIRGWREVVETAGAAAMLQQASRLRAAAMTEEEALNVAHLVQLAEKYESRWGFWEFSDWLWQRLVEGGGESEAVVEEGVAVTTVHQAKGREWPLVVVAGFPSQGRPDYGVIEDPYAGVGVKVGDVSTVGYEAVKASRDAAAAAEERRLWYVALTRARDYTVVVDPAGFALAAGLPRTPCPWSVDGAVPSDGVVQRSAAPDPDPAVVGRGAPPSPYTGVKHLLHRAIRLASADRRAFAAALGPPFGPALGFVLSRPWCVPPWEGPVPVWSEHVDFELDLVLRDAAGRLTAVDLLPAAEFTPRGQSWQDRARLLRSAGVTPLMRVRLVDPFARREQDLVF
jgi:ATP-dependent helicase/nuclease subunit A